jgi:SAM-dependent methyltransferase
VHIDPSIADRGCAMGYLREGPPHRFLRLVAPQGQRRLELRRGSAAKGGVDGPATTAAGESDRLPLRLHLGCGVCTPPGWVNVDCALGARLARVPGLGRACRALGLIRLEWPTGIVIHDLRRPFPWADGAAEAVYSAHTLEHLSREEGLRFVRECRRVLRPGGVLRLVVPDLRSCVDRYLEGKVDAGDFLETLGVETVLPGEGRLRRWLAPHVRFPHRCMYDGETLPALLREVGFETELADPLRSRIPDVAALEHPDRTVAAVIAEGVKP